jgi:transcription antitermination factor NusB
MSNAPPGEPGARWEGRRKAREAALQMLYLAEVGGVPAGAAAASHPHVGDAEAIPLDDRARAYADTLMRGAWDSRDALDGYIADAARNWRIERLAMVDRQLLRLAIHELIAFPGTPPRVVIDEAIELARMYSGDEATKFVNGVLDAVYRKLKEEGKIVE